MFSPRAGQPPKITSSSPNELLSMLCCIIRYRDSCIRLHVTQTVQATYCTVCHWCYLNTVIFCLNLWQWYCSGYNRIINIPSCSAMQVLQSYFKDEHSLVNKQCLRCKSELKVGVDKKQYFKHLHILLCALNKWIHRKLIFDINSRGGGRT